MPILEITPLIGCSNVCEYCPQTTLIKQYREKCSDDKEMSLEQFKKYISTIPTDVDIHFTGYVEPLLAKDAPEMIEHAYAKGHRVMLNTTLMGMTPELWDRFSKNIVFKDVHIHLPSGSYEEMIGVKKPTEWFELDGKKYKRISDEYFEMVRHMLMNPSKNIHGVEPHWHCHGDMHPQLVQLQQHVNVGIRDINSRAMNLLLEKKEKVPEKNNIRGKCPRVTQNVLLPSGHLSLCCQDYGLDEIMGNLSEQTWSEYMNSDHAQEVFKNGADMCDYCEENVDYVDDTTWGQWRRVRNKKAAENEVVKLTVKKTD